MEHELRHLLRYFGVMGICVGEAETEAGAGVRWALLARCYPFALLLALGGCVWGVTRQPSYAAGYELSWLVSSIVLVAHLLTHLLIVGEALAQRGAHADFLRCLDEVEARLKLCLRLPLRRRALVQRHLRTFCALLAVSACSLVAFVVALQLTTDGAHQYYVLASNLALRSRLLQLWLYARLVAAHMECLNGKLLQVHGGRRVLDVPAQRGRTLDGVALLAAVRDTLQLLHAAVEHVNALSGWSVAAIIAVYTLDCTCHVYWWLLTLDRMLPALTYVTSVCTLLPVGVMVCKYCAACNDCTKQGVHFTQLWHRLLLQQRDGSRRRLAAPVYRNFVSDVLLQLQHQPFVFTARQFFAIDLRLLLAILVAIITYLVILIQFLPVSA